MQITCIKDGKEYKVLVLDLEGADGEVRRVKVHTGEWFYTSRGDIKIIYNLKQ